MGIDPIYLAAGNMQHIVEKLSTKATTLLQIASRSELCTRSYAPSKSRESQLAGFRDSRTGVPGEKNHLDVGSVESHRVYYKGEGGDFPKSEPWWIKWVQGCPWPFLAPKVLQLCTNHFVRVLCKPMWVSEWSLSTLPSPIPELQHAPLPLKCCELGSVPRLLLFPLLTWTHIWILQGVGGASLRPYQGLPVLTI